jgi:prepilin-type N-terminal cleavage/methylation domain-containing protein
MLVNRPIPSRRPTPAAAAPRRGFTLAELVVALLLFSLVGGSILTLVMRQQRFYRSTADVIKLQGQLRQGASILPVDLRGISTSDTLLNQIVNGVETKYNADIYSKNDWSLEFRRTFGGSMICHRRASTAPPTDTIRILPTSTARIPVLTSWAATPVVGDSILVLDDWTMVGPGDDRWVAYEIKAVAPVSGAHGCPWKQLDTDAIVAGNQFDSTPVLYQADNARNSYKITLNSEISPTIIVGAPVRFFRRVRYEIYRAPDEQWYLGYSDCLKTYADGCSEVTPVAGPYQAYTGIPGENGIVFAYFDSLGNALALNAESRKIARVDVIMRSITDRAISRTGTDAGQQRRDSVLLSIGIRNRR